MAWRFQDKASGHRAKSQVAGQIHQVGAYGRESSSQVRDPGAEKSQEEIR